MRNPVYTGQFKRDLKAAKKRGKDMEKIKKLMLLLLEGQSLPLEYRDHPLKGRWHNFQDAHIEPDWLLIYKIAGDEVYFERTGRHVDLLDR
ncbi:MAG: type II toxin-antitoxin system mRNA interferase toxin, RelE/StbE family [Gammaproteobacteria bacterium]|nr:type II toxin-antitoxin system mRNA interferase toxin, RelE/StbE family [Gammaproteobacteria bacterium]